MESRDTGYSSLIQAVILLWSFSSWVIVFQKFSILSSVFSGFYGYCHNVG
jgi:hypothetical protein